ncbi:MAG: ABC transporter permease [Firmicutes bacterium]|jgi:sodium transport system permease protein|nr:ABC transporter permease [Bacillota bacterium]
MLNDITNIWRKEVTDSIRDRKALIQALLIPLLIGIFYATFMPILNSAITARTEAPLIIPARGVAHADPTLVEVFGHFGVTLKEYEGDLEDAISRAEESAGLVIPPGFAEDVAAERPAALTLLTNQTAGGIFGGTFSGQRLDLAISQYNQVVSAARVASRDLDPALLTPVSLSRQDLASPAQLGGLFAGFSLPLLLALIVAQGGLFVAIDVTAGERERGTLEALLVTPASDFSVVVGKLLAVFTISIAPLLLTFLAFWVVSNLLPESVTRGAVLPGQVILGAILIGLPLAVFLDVVLMIVSVRARAFKDAQSAATPVVLGAIVPAFVAAFVPATSPVAYLIPLYGSFAALGRIVQTGSLQAGAILVSAAGSMAGALILLRVALRLFNRERLLYGS